MKILFIENHEVFARVTSEQFLQGYEVTVAPSRASVEEHLSRGSFDIFLVDYDLDDCKGDSIVQTLREKFPRALIVGVSSKDTGNARLIDAGANISCKKSDFARLSSLLARHEKM